MSREEERGLIEFRLSGTKDGQEVRPVTLEVKYVIDLLNNVYRVFSSISATDKEAKLVGLRVQEGSNSVVVKPLKKYADDFEDYSLRLKEGASSDIPMSVLEFFDELQQTICKDRDLAYTVRKGDNAPIIQIDSTTNYLIKRSLSFKSTVNLYGTVYEMGGKTKPNIHISTERYGDVTVFVSDDFFTDANKKLLKQQCKIVAEAYVDIETGLIDSKKDRSLVLKSIIPFSGYTGVTEEDIKKGTEMYGHIKNAGEYIRELRGE